MKDDNDPIIGVVLFIISVVVCIGLVISRREENKKALEVKKETETQDG